ncbi:MAG: hypothetical protein RSF40_01520 [Oscillospiraceae bacterium]
MARKPLYKEAYELAEQYKLRGVKYCYNQRNKCVYLSVLDAPTCVPNVDGCQLTGYLTVYGGVIQSRDIDRWVDEVKRNFISEYKDNPVMLKYAETIKTA